MKKLMVLFFTVFMVSTTLQADNDKIIQLSQLPQPAQQFIKTHFAKKNIALTKLDNGIFNKSYEVIFTDGTKVEFLGNGNWEEVDCRYSSVPDAIVPSKIISSVTKNYPDTKIIKIEKDSSGDVEINLSNRLELTFNSDYNLIDIDD